MSDAFYYVEWDEDCDWDESYDMLRGPDGFECLLTEPEDRIWLRDGRPVIEKLNEQAVTIATLTARLAAAEAARDEARRFLAAAHVALSEVAPCGHYNRFIEWEDHSKPIACVKCKLDAAEAAAQWCWVRLGDADYDLACVKWPWLNA